MRTRDEIRLRLNHWAFGSGIACLLVLWLAIRRYYTPGFFVFDGLPQFFLFCLIFAVYLAIAFSAVRHWKRDLRRGLWLPVTFLIITLAVVAILKHYERKRAEVPAIFSAHYDGDINGVGITLRTDGTYEALDGSVIGGDILYGDYRLRGNTVYLAREHFRFGDATWRFGRYLMITDSSVVCAYEPNGNDQHRIVMRITQDDRATHPKE